MDLIDATAHFGAQAAHQMALELYGPTSGASSILSDKMSTSLAKILQMRENYCYDQQLKLQYLARGRGCDCTSYNVSYLAFN